MNPLLSTAALRALRSTVSRPGGGVFSAVLLGCLAVFSPAPAFSQLLTETGPLFGDGASDQNFGLEVAASSDTIVASAANNHFFIYTKTSAGWVLQQKFTDSNANAASDLAVDGDTMLARGMVYVRTNGTWTPQQAIASQHPTAALQGNTLVIGSPFNRVSNRGQVDIYARTGTTWSHQVTFNPEGPDQFLGDSVALDGDTVVASSESTGGAYVYVRNNGTWTRQARLILPSGSGWGMHVALEGDIAAASDPAYGHVYIYSRTGTDWTLAQVLSLPEGGGTNFGYRLAMNGGVLAIGADTQYYLYNRSGSTWQLAQTISRPGYRLEGGLALADGGKLLVLGNPDDDTKGSNAGIVDVFAAGTPPPPPPDDWHDADIGAVGIAGSSSGTGTNAQVKGSGADIYDRADQFHFRSQTMTGDGAIIARVDSIDQTDGWAKAGLMFREDFTPGARNVMAFVAAGGPVGMQVRAAPGSFTTFQGAPWMGAPLWLMLVRSGDLFASYWSSDGDNWTPIGSATVTMPATLMVGLAVTSHDNTRLNTSAFSGIEFAGAPPPPPPTAPNAPSNLRASLQQGTDVQLQWNDNSTDETGFSVERSEGTGSGTYSVIGTNPADHTFYTDAGLAANTTYTYRVRAVNGSASSAPSNTFTITTTSAALSGSQFGASDVGGSFTQSGDSVTINAAGDDIWNQLDSGYFVHRKVTGDFDLRAQVTSLSNTHPWAKAGVMVRDSLGGESRNLFTMVSAQAAAGLQVRDTASGDTVFTEGRWVNAPYWVRLVRSGDTFQSFISEDGATWQLVATRTLALPATLHAGVASSSHTNTKATATFTSLSFGN
jgi:regulation of enolase protein 1 (concanavalin A-like superfamily)